MADCEALADGATMADQRALGTTLVSNSSHFSYLYDLDKIIHIFFDESENHFIQFQLNMAL